MLKRLLSLPPRPKESFFLWGPRQAGKSTLLLATYPDALRIDLLKTDLFVRYTQAPKLLREELLARRRSELVILDDTRR